MARQSYRAPRARVSSLPPAVRSLSRLSGQAARTPLATAVLGAFGALVCATAAAQSTPPVEPQKLDRVEITGSSIKRIDGEAALPVQVIKREDIERLGVTTAAELLKTISANTAPLSDGVSITDGTSGQRGFNGANLRGLGVSSTLILLNGRRMANFATPGDNAGVDLNNIPAGAIQRVEILKDGASAVYGTDAIGGVVNFITRRDYQGFDISSSLAKTEEGGAGKRTLALSAGAGDLAKDRYNLFAAFDYQKLEALRSSQRSFIQERPLSTTLPALMSSNTFPANIDISAGQRNALITAGLLPTGTTRTRINPSWPGCNPPATVFTPQGPGGPVACSYDYMRDTEIYPESERVGIVSRGSLQAGADTTLFAEVMAARASSLYRLSPNPVSTIRFVPVALLPEPLRTALTGGGLPTTVSRLRWRLADAGGRTNDVTSDANRVVLGVSGTAGSWDYETAFTRAENKVVDKYVGGYVLFNELEAGVLNGTLNPFGAQSAAGRAYLDRITVNDEARSSRGVSSSIDAKSSRALAPLAGGDLMLAVGGEIRREKTNFTPSALLVSNNIQGDRDSSGLSTALTATEDARNVTSLFTEFSAPFTRTLEAQFAVRYDRYNDAGNSTNPKAGVRWQPTPQLVVRGSAGTGFRAPSLWDLNQPTSFGVTSSLITDPQCAAVEGSIDLCTDQWNVERRSNPGLKPEKSRQFSFGAVYELNRQWSGSLDYWNIEKRDVISTLGEQVIIQNPDKYNGVYIQRDVDGFISNIILQKENQGRLRTQGVDVTADWRGVPTGAGRFSVGLNGTYVLKYDRQFGPQEPYRSNLGVFLNDQVIQRWRHRLSLGWDFGPVSLTLANQYVSGHTDQNVAYDPVTDAKLPDRKVEAYSLWDLTGRWAASKNVSVRGGVLNLRNTDPPFSNQTYYFLSTYDPTYTDPRGRTYYVAIDISFK